MALALQNAGSGVAMRILLVSHVCAIGGAETFMLALRAGLVAAGHCCELMFFKHGRLAPHLPSDCVVHFGDVSDCLRLVARRGFDVVHARSSDWPMGLAAVRRLGTRLVVTSHGLIESAWTSSTCDAFVACASWLAAQQQPLTDLPVRVVLNGVDTEKFSPDWAAPPSSPPIVAWVGRGVQRRKRLDRFAAIAPALRTAGLRIWLAEPYGPEIVAAERDPEVANTLRARAEFWGAVGVEEMPAFYRTIAASGGCVVSTTEWEGLPLVLLEAQACGCPVIAPNVNGTNECVSGMHGGVLYPPDMPTADLAALVIETIADATQMTDRRRAAARFVREEFSGARMAKEYVRVYEEAPDRPLAVDWIELIRSPKRRWQDYIEHRWPEGERQYELSRTLAMQGDWDLAQRAAEASLTTSPTLYVRPARLAHFARTHLRASLHVIS